MFQFPRFPPLVLCVQTRVTPHDGCRVSPFGHPRIEARSTAPRGFSQSPTSFIGSRRQGIHRWLFVAWKSKMLVLAMEFSRCARGAAPEGAGAGSPEAGGDPKGRPRATLRPSGPQRATGGCPFKTEQKDRTPGDRHGRRKQQPSTAVAACGSSSQWSTGCSLEDAGTEAPAPGEAP